MKKGIRRIAALVLAMMLLIGMAGCATHSVTIAGKPYEVSVSSGDYAIKVGDYKVTPLAYKRTMANLRLEHLNEISVTESESLWLATAEGEQTLSDVFAGEAQRLLIEEGLFIDRFDRLGLEFTDAMEQEVQQALREMVSTYGGIAAFNASMEYSNYNYDEYQTAMRNQIKRRMVLDYYFEEYTPEKLDARYASENALIKYIYISKTDSEMGDLLEGKALADARARAEDAYQSALREKDRFDDLLRIHSDYSSTDYTVVPNTEEAKEEFRKQVFALPIGGIALIEGETEYLIVKRYDPIAEGYITDDLRYSLLETLCADRINDLLQQWAAETKIEVNLELTDQYRPEKMMNE